MAISIIWRCFSGRLSSEPEEISPSEARSEVSGVRSSWLTVEMNSSFIFSRRRRSETSWKATTMPEIWPSSMSGLALYSTGNGGAVATPEDLIAHADGSQRRMAWRMGLVVWNKACRQRGCVE